jgi:hypothetical protein
MRKQGKRPKRKRATRIDWTENIRNQDNEYCFVSNISVKYVDERSGKDIRQRKYVNKHVSFQSRRHWIWLVVGLLHELILYVNKDCLDLVTATWPSGQCDHGAIEEREH